MDIKNIENIYECSPLQKGMLFHTLHQSSTNLYVEQISFKIAGDLDVEHFRQAWEQTIDRHDSLRTTFHWKETDKLLQVVHKDVELFWSQEDWDMRSTNAAQSIREFSENVKNEGINISEGPLMKFHLIHLNDCVQFIWTFHHLLMDGWSMPLVLKDVIHFYKSIQDGDSSYYPDAPQYHKYISWLQKQDSENAKDFFKARFENFQEPSYISDHHSPHRHSVQDRHKDLILSGQSRRSLEELSRKHNVTLYSIFQAAWAMVINRHSDKDDIVFGNVVSGRQPELRDSESIVGPFINTLPLRIKLKANDSLLSVVTRVQQEQTKLTQYEFTPLYEIQKLSGLDSNKQLFDSIIVFENYPFDEKIFDYVGFTISDFLIEEKSNFPLSLAIIPYQDTFVLRFHYDSNVMEDTDIQQLLNTTLMLVEAIYENIHCTVDSLTLFKQGTPTPLITNKMEDKRSERLKYITLHERFEDQVQICPDKLAVKTKTHSYSYAELNQRADHLAQYLRSQGLQTQDSVAVLMNRSPDMIVAIIGILKAGGVYIPLDEQMPNNRKQFILNDSKSKYILTCGEVSEFSFYGVGNIDIRNLPLFNEKLPISNKEMNPNNIAYIMYTSGSTGLPKGVAVSHRASLLHYLSFIEQFELNAMDNILQFGTTTFDPSLEQIFSSLFSGAELFIREDSFWDPEAFISNINSQKITVANLPTPYWNEMVNYFDRTKQYIDMPSLRILAIGGDSLTSNYVEKWNKLNKGSTNLYNFYGPTEIVTTCTFFPLSEGTFSTNGTIPIGYPFPNRKIYVLDSMGRIVPPGKKGELCIGGEILSSGYLNRPDLTAKSFVPDPYSVSEGARMYKTGDIVRYSLDGRIEFSGRIDDQLKIRGYRVEIGEIESALLAIPTVKEALVLLSNVSDPKMLIAYVTTFESVSGQIIKTELETKLPEYMVPKHIHILNEFPLLTNGKIDRKTLSELEIPNYISESENDNLPTSDRHKRLVEIWEEVLQVKPIGIRDNFFELGGDSILALQIIARAQENSILLSTQDIFEFQTIKKLDDVTFHHMKQTEKNEFMSDSPTPIVPIQQWFFENEFDNPHHWNQSILLRTKEQLNFLSLESAVEQLIQHHEAFNTKFRAGDGYWTIVEDRENAYSIEFVDISTHSHKGEKIIKEAIIQGQSSLNIKDGPLVKAIVFSHKEKKESLLFLTIHHLIVDGVSWRILLEDLQTLYQGIQNNNKVILPAEVTSYKEWAFTLKQYAQGQEIVNEIPIWEKITKIGFEIPKLLDRTDMPNREEDIKERRIKFSKMETKMLLTQVNRTLGLKIQEVLIASLVITLKKWSNDSHIKVDLEGHGREPLVQGVNLSRTVGWFTTIFPFSIEFSEETSLLQEVTHIIRRYRALPHNGIGFGILKYLSGIKFDEEYPSEVSFNYLGQINTSEFKSSLFEMENDSVEPLRDKKSERAYLLDLEGAIYNGELSLNWMYNPKFHKEETIELLSATFRETIESILNLAGQFKTEKYQPKDFPKVNLSKEEWQIVNQHPHVIEDIYPLTPAQEGMLFHTLMNPESGVYMEQMSFSLKGSISIEGFQKAWEHVVNQNAILRANYLWEGVTNPIHIINQKSKLDFHVLDWRGRESSFEDLEKDLKSVCRTQRLEKINLGTDSLIKMTLIKLKEDTYYFIWSYHHLLIDGWSMPMVVNQFLESYKRIASGDIPIVSASRPFGDFIKWQCEQDTFRNKDFWKESLKGYENRTKLVNKGEQIGHKGQHEHREVKRKLSMQLTGRLKDLAEREKTTLNTIIQTSWAIFLHFICNKEKVIFGSVLSGRSAPIIGIEKMVGMFINTLPVGLNIVEKEPIGKSISKMHRLLTKINEAEGSSFIEIKEWINYKSKEPLFDTCLIFANFPNLMSSEENPELLKDIVVSGIEVTEQTNFPLTVSIVPGEQISLDINYNCSLFTLENIELYFEILENILNEMTISPERPITEIRGALEKVVVSRKQKSMRQQKESNRNLLTKRKRSPLEHVNS